jgi:hypothetical protein
MTKHRKVRRTRRQRGGFWPFSSSEPVDPYAPKKPGFFQGIGDFFSSGVQKTEEALGPVVNTANESINAMAEGASSLNPFSSPSSSSTGYQQSDYAAPAATSPVTSPVTSPNGYTGQGGRRKRRARSMKGGKDGSNLVYYAAPVSGLKVVEPTTWQYYGNGVNQYSVKGGSKKRKSRKSRRTRRHKRR